MTERAQRLWREAELELENARHWRWFARVETALIVLSTALVPVHGWGFCLPALVFAFAAGWCWQRYRMHRATCDRLVGDAEAEAAREMRAARVLVRGVT